jgi:osmotically-inducible protein OsmY
MLNPGDSLDERVESALNSHPSIPKRSLRFETREGRVTLHGKVASWYQKQMAQEALRRLDGIHSIDNRLEVSWHHDVPLNSAVA